MGAFDLDFDEDVHTSPGKPLPNYRPSNFRYKPKQPVSQSRVPLDLPRTVPPQPKGRVVDTSSADWMRECLARYVACLPLGRSLAFVLDYEASKGKVAANRLEADVRAVEVKGYLDEMDLSC